MKTAYVTIKGFEVMRMFKKGQVTWWIDTTAVEPRRASSTACSAFMREPPTRSGLHATRPDFCNGAVTRLCTARGGSRVCQLAACAGVSSPRPQLAPPGGRPLISQERGQPLLSLAPFLVGAVESFAQIVPLVLEQRQMLAQHLHFDL
jgi:hypothetical protein